MNNNIMKFGYEDTDKKIEIEIYGIRFEINKEKIDETKNINEFKESEDLDIQIKELLGENSIERLNKKRLSDGYKEMTIDVQLQILKFIYIVYAKCITDNVVNGVQETVEQQKSRITNTYNPNRQERRNNKYKRNYRRY